MANLALKLRESAEVIASTWCDLGTSSELRDVSAMDDATLLNSVASITQHITLAQSLAATLAGEIELRSSRDLGHSGLAARNGFTTPERLVQTVTKSTKAEAAALVQTGRLMRDAGLEPAVLPVVTGEVDDAGCPIPLLDESGNPVTELVEVNPTPWLTPVARAVVAGELSAAAAASIRRGLGDVSDLLGADRDEHYRTTLLSNLARAAEQLVQQATHLDADQLFKRARQLRDDLDYAGVAERERAQHDARYFKVWQRADGAVAGSFLYGSEDGAMLIAAANSAMSSRRGGPRFVDSLARSAAQALLDDPRTNDQMQADAFMAMVRLAVDADPQRIFGHNRPAVKVLVIADRLNRDASGNRQGFGRIEGTHEAVSLETVDRLLCDTGAVGMSFTGEGHALDLGREARLFSKKQREVMAARDGGCIGSESCSAPPAMCEAHHIDHWSENGRTDVDSGVLLCRFHHMSIHNNGYRIVRDDGAFWLIPPPSHDPQQSPVRMRSNNPDFARELLAAPLATTLGECARSSSTDSARIRLHGGALPMPSKSTAGRYTPSTSVATG